MKLIADINGHRQEFLLKEGVNVIGRDMSCDITLLGKSISRRHVACTVQGQRCFLRDLGSRNGTFIGEEQVTEAEIKAGDAVLFGTVPVRLSLGTPPGAAAVEEPQGMPEMQREIVAPKLPEYTEDGDPTPVDGTFGPSDGTAEGDPVPVTLDEPEPINALAVVQGGVPAEVRVIEAKPVRRALTFREKMLFFIPAGAVLLIIIAVLAMTLSRKEEDQTDVLKRSEYNRYLDRAVELYRKGDQEKALKLLEVLGGKRVQNDPLTAQMLADAFRRNDGLEKPDAFQDRWTSAMAKWSELEDYSQSTQAIRDLAGEKQTWITGESANLGNYTTFLSQYRKGELTEALKTAQRVANDSIFREGIDQQAGQVRDKLVKEAMDRAQHAEGRQQWAAAIKGYEEVEALIEPVPAAVVAGKRRCEQHRMDQRAVGQAQALVDAGKYAEADRLLGGVKPDGPYGDEYKRLKAVIKTAADRTKAITLYDAKKADEALDGLRRAGLANDALTRKMEQVRDAWQKAQAAIKTNDFEAAKKHCRDIERLERSDKNGYLFEAKQFLASAVDRAHELARAIRDAGVKAYEKGDFSLARKKYDEATRMDPKGQTGRTEVAALIKEAGREYNAALNLLQKDPQKALGILRNVKARLRPGDPYYDKTDERIKDLEDGV